MENLTLIIGFNSTNLFGTYNDINNMYNMINILDFKSKVVLLKDESATFKNIILNINSFSKINCLVFYFSGNGTNKGELKLFDKNISINDLAKKIKIKINKIIYILDCCFSENFIKENKFINIKKIILLSSCSKDQKSKEVLMKINDEYQVNGIFTYYFCKIVRFKKLYKISQWEKIVESDIWFIIEQKFSQKFTYKIFSNCF